MTKTAWLRGCAALVATSLGALSPAFAEVIVSQPIGFDEVPAVLSPAKAEFRATVNRDASEVHYELRYWGFQTKVTQAHVHFGNRNTNGGIMVFICSNLPGAPAGTPPCPEQSGAVTGTWTSQNVIGPAKQGIQSGAEALASVVEAMRHGSAYVNLHTDVFESGEIRDQVGLKGHRVRGE